MKWAPALLALAVVLCGPLPTVAADCTIWSQSRCDAQNQAAIELRPDKTDKTDKTDKSVAPRAWTFDGSGRVWGYEPGLTVWSSPALGEADGQPLLVAGNYDHTVYALSAATGDVLWKFTTGGPVYSAPVFFRDGGRQLLIAASNDRIVYAIDPALGRQVWVHAVADFRPTLGGARLAAPCVGGTADQDKQDNAVFVPYWIWDRSLASNMQSAGIVALSTDDGRPLWRTELGDGELTAAIFVRLQGRGVLFLGSSSGNVFAVAAADGRVLWKKAELDCVRNPPAFLATEQGPLLVTGSKFGTVRGLDAASGAERWQFRTGDRITGSPAVWSGKRPRIFVGSYDRSLYALDVGGGSLWHQTFRGGIYSSAAILGDGSADGALVLTQAWDHMLHVNQGDDGRAVFSAFTGRPLWNVGGMDDSNWSSPAVGRIAGHAMAFVGSYDGLMRAFPLDADQRSAPELRSNLGFWLSFPLFLGPVAALAIFLTRRDRRRSLSQRK
jgi:outer membrane protein assembly factor BamB